MKRSSTTVATNNDSKESKSSLHPSQAALVKRCVKTLAKDRPIIVASDTGTGKTDMARGIAKRVAKTLDRPLFVLVTTDAAQAKKLSPAFGGMYANAFNFGNVGGVRKELQKEGCASITMTARFFKENFLSLQEGKALHQYEQLFLAPTAPKEVYFFLDEVESYVKDWRPRLKKMRTTSTVPVTVVGLSATPGVNTLAYGDIFGNDPERLAFSDEEQAAWDADMKVQPEPPKAWTTKYKIKGLPGVAYANAVQKLRDLLLGDKILTTFGNAGQAPPIDSWAARQDILGTILAEKAAGGGDGGLVFQALDEALPMSAVGGATKPCSESILIAHWADKGIQRHVELLGDLRDSATGEVIEGVLRHTVHDLTSKLLAKSKEALHGFNASFKEQATGATLGFIKPANAKSTNDMAKNVTGIIAIGQWPKDKLRQLRGRIGRVAELDDGDIVPQAFKLVHIASDWADAVSTAWSRSASYRTLAKPSGFEDLLATAKKEHPDVASRIDAKVGTLLKLDTEKLLGESELAMAYLKALTNKKALTEAKDKYAAARDDASFDPCEDGPSGEEESDEGVDEAASDES